MCAASTPSTSAGMSCSTRNLASALTESVYAANGLRALGRGLERELPRRDERGDGGPDAAAVARRARLRRASRMLVTEEWRRMTWVPPGHRCEPRPPCPTLEGYRMARAGRRIRTLYPRCAYVVSYHIPA